MSITGLTDRDAASRAATAPAQLTRAQFSTSKSHPWLYGGVTAVDKPAVIARKRGTLVSDRSPALVGAQKAAAQRLLVDYARLIDDRDAEGWADLFGAEGALVFGEKEIRGRQRLIKFAANSTRGIHVQGVASFSAHADGSVASTSSFVFVNAESGKLIAGWYRDVLAPEGENYVFTRRHIDIRTAP